MITVGLTGGIGSGKTYISNLFQEIGIAIYNSDYEAKELMHTNIKIKQSLIERFGSESYLNNQLNRVYIADKIFKDKEQLHWLNSIIHPAVADDFHEWKQKHKDKPYVIKEAAILIESGAYKTCEKIIIVSAPEQVRIERVIKRDKITIDQVKARMANQISDKERIKHANFVIDNNGTNNVMHQIKEIHNNILNIKL